MKSLSESFDKPGITTIAYVKMNPDTKVHKKVEIISETSKKIISLPLNSTWWLGSDIVDDAINLWNFINDA